MAGKNKKVLEMIKHIFYKETMKNIQIMKLQFHPTFKIHFKVSN